jgi:hypothetical protein
MPIFYVDLELGMVEAFEENICSPILPSKKEV